MIISLCYIVLVVITLYTIRLSIAIYKNCHSLIPVVPIVIMYMWSIYGSWSWIPFRLSGGETDFEALMYRVNIDEYYLLSLVLYSFFIVVFGTVELSYVRRRRKFLSSSSNVERYKFYIEKLADNRLYLIISFGFLFIFLLLSYRDIIAAVRSGVSAYVLSRFDSTTNGINSLISFCGETYVYMILPVFFSDRFKKKVVPLFTFGLYFLFNFLLGNRNILLTSLVIFFLLYAELNGIKKALKPRNDVLLLALLLGIQLISFLRGLSITDLASHNKEFTLGNLFMSLFSSSEFYSAQFSLYGLLKYDVGFTYGSSVLFLISTLVPSFLGIPRPQAIYHYYVLGTTHQIPELGVTMHHAAAWYLNFGFIGIVLGALLWAYVLKFLFIRKKSFIYMYGAILFSANSIPMIRGGGLEIYKGCLLLCTIIPMLLIYFYGVKFKRVAIHN